ncbi:MAG: glycosyltransferase [Chloroflexota bacterium]|nr:glycosyltransferase [Chloroflexota bacterium]
MMRVLYFTGSYRPDSMVSHTHGELVTALRARGVMVEIATVGAAMQAEEIESSTDRYGTTVWSLRLLRSRRQRLMNVYAARLWAFAPFGGLVAALKRFLTADRLANYDILHIGMAYPYATAFRHALHNCRTPLTLVTITGGDVLTNDETGYGYGRRRVPRVAIRRTLRWANLVQANSPQTAAAVERYGCPNGHIVVQPPQTAHEPLAADAIPAYRARCREELEREGAIPRGPLLVGIGRMVAIKGYDDAIRALPLIRATHPDTTLLLAGPARDAAAQAYVASLRTLATSLGQHDSLRIMDQLPFEAVPHYFAAADLALIPSLLDGLNMTGVEAGAVGTPSVISAAAGLATSVDQFGAGSVVPPRDPAALAAAILSLLDDRTAWERASRGANHMATSFSLDRTADGVLGLYQRLLAG